MWDWYTLSDFLLFQLDPVLPPNDHLWVKRKHPKSHLRLWENSISVLPSPIDTLFSFEMYVALIGWKFVLFTKTCPHFSERTPRLFLVSQSQELRRSEFLISNWGYVEAKACFCQPPNLFLSWPKSPVAWGDTLQLSAHRHWKTPSLIDKQRPMWSSAPFLEMSASSGWDREKVSFLPSDSRVW